MTSIYRNLILERLIEMQEELADMKPGMPETLAFYKIGRVEAKLEEIIRSMSDYIHVGSDEAEKPKPESSI